MDAFQQVASKWFKNVIHAYRSQRQATSWLYCKNQWWGTISQTNSTKHLGVYIDDKLTWSDHITNLEKTTSSSVGIFYRIRRYLNERALKSLYFNIVYSHLQYGIGAWGGVGKTSLRRLNVLHNKIVRPMAYSSFRSELDPLYKYLNPLKVDDI